MPARHQRSQGEHDKHPLANGFSLIHLPSQEKIVDLGLQDATEKFAALDLNWRTCLPEEVIGLAEPRIFGRNTNKKERIVPEVKAGHSIPLKYAIAVMVGSIAAFWVVYIVLLRLFPDGDKLSEFGAITSALIVNYWTNALFNWLATGKFIPGPGTDVSREGPDSTIGNRFIGRSSAIIFLSVAWLGSWFYATFLHGQFRADLFDSSNTMGVSLSEEVAMRISTELSGLLALGIMLPLFAASAFVISWACSSSLRVSVMLIPATAFSLTTVTLNYGGQILATGRPPMYDALRMILHVPEGPVAPVDLVVMWGVNIAALFIGCWALAGYGRIWTALGFSLRRIVVKNES